MTRGYKLNNPFNIEKSSIKWHGQVLPSSDAVFCQFETAVMGLRAGFIDIKNNVGKGITLKAFITKYAPPSENSTDAYIQAVFKDTGIDPTKQLEYKDIKTLGIAIIKHEQGSMIYDDTTINQALILAALPV